MTEWKIVTQSCSVMRTTPATRSRQRVRAVATWQSLARTLSRPSRRAARSRLASPTHLRRVKSSLRSKASAQMAFKPWLAAFWGLATELLRTDKPDDPGETQCATPNAIEMNPYSARFDPGKYFAYTRKRAHTTCLIIAEDNEAVIKIIAKARSMALRHLPRTHRIDVHWLFEVCSHPRVRMLYVNTKQQIADPMTKALKNLLLGSTYWILRKSGPA